jgi:hypothetical protein
MSRGHCTACGALLSWPATNRHESVCRRCYNDPSKGTAKPATFPASDVDDPDDVAPEGSFERTRDMLDGTTVAALTAENARLRAENALALGLLCDVAAEKKGAVALVQAWLLGRMAITERGARGRK